MNQAEQQLKNDDVVLTDIRLEQIRIIYSAVPSSLLVILVNSAILSTLLWNVIDHGIITWWFLATNSLSLVRYYLHQRFDRLDREKTDTTAWYQLAILTSAFSGASWGAAGIWLFSNTSIAHQVFLAFVISGMCAGAISTLSSIRKAARSFVLLAILPK